MVIAAKYCQEAVYKFLVFGIESIDDFIPSYLMHDRGSRLYQNLCASSQSAPQDVHDFLVGSTFQTSTILRDELDQIGAPLEVFERQVIDLLEPTQPMPCLIAIWCLHVAQKVANGCLSQRAPEFSVLAKNIQEIKEAVEKDFVGGLANMISGLDTGENHEYLWPLLVKINGNLFFRPCWFTTEPLNRLSILLTECVTKCESIGEKYSSEAVMLKRDIHDRLSEYDVEGAIQLLTDQPARKKWVVCPTYETDYYQCVFESQSSILRIASTFGFCTEVGTLNMSSDETVRMFLEQQTLDVVLGSPVNEWRTPVAQFLDKILDCYARSLSCKVEHLGLINGESWRRADTGLLLLKVGRILIEHIKEVFNRCDSDLQARVLLNIYSPLLVSGLVYGDLPGIIKVTSKMKSIDVLIDSINRILPAHLAKFMQAIDRVSNGRQCVRFSTAIHILQDYAFQVDSMNAQEMSFSLTDRYGKQLERLDEGLRRMPLASTSNQIAETILKITKSPFVGTYFERIGYLATNAKCDFKFDESLDTRVSDAGALRSNNDDECQTTDFPACGYPEDMDEFRRSMGRLSIEYSSRSKGSEAFADAIADFRLMTKDVECFEQQLDAVASYFLAKCRDVRLEGKSLIEQINQLTNWPLVMKRIVFVRVVLAFFKRNETQAELAWRFGFVPTTSTKERGGLPVYLNKLGMREEHLRNPRFYEPLQKIDIDWIYEHAT